MVNSKGNKVANQFIIENGQKTVFQSYQSTIAEYDRKTGILKVFTDWDYSQTTLKYFKKFVEEYTPHEYGTKAQWIRYSENHEKISYM